MRYGYVQYLIDMDTGEIVPQTLRTSTERVVPKKAHHWEIICNNDVVTVNVKAEAEDRGEKKIGDARWTNNDVVKRKSVVEHYEVGAAQWSVIEESLRRVYSGVEPVGEGAVKQSLPTTAAQIAAERESNAQHGSVFNWAVGAGLVAVIAGIILRTTAEPRDHIISTAIIALGIAIVFYGGFGARSQCPKCTSWFKRTRTNRRKIGERDIQKQVQVKETVYDSSNKATGNHTYRTESRNYTRTEYEDTYRCNKCQHSWKYDWFSDSAS